MATDPAYDTLTPREREVLDLMARGLTNGQIAEHLDIGFETAKSHVSHIIAKTAAETREEAVLQWKRRQRPGTRTRRFVRALVGIPFLYKSGFAAASLTASAGAVAVTLVVAVASSNGSSEGSRVLSGIETPTSTLLPVTETPTPNPTPTTVTIDEEAIEAFVRELTSNDQLAKEVQVAAEI